MLSNLVAGISKVGEGFDGEINEPIDIHFHKLLGPLPQLIIYINSAHLFDLLHIFPFFLCTRGQQNLWWLWMAVENDNRVVGGSEEAAGQLEAGAAQGQGEGRH